jgi:riboflavin kinase / FMN adenylyltransferase
MKVYRGIGELPGDGPVVATIGNFDGVHRGHQWVMEEVIRRAQELAAGSLAITFDPHPVRVLRPEKWFPLITPLGRKLELIAETGVDATVVIPFTHELSHMSAREFARVVLVEAAGVVEVHEGENFRFGYQAEAGIDGLEQIGRELGFRVRAYAPRSLRGGPVSSSRVRALVGAGEMNQARVLLGRAFAVESTPASGRGFGTRYTVPTINLAAYSELLPANGVYVTTMTVAGEEFDAVTNVGNRPTFGEDSFTVESYLLNFHPIELNEATPLKLEFHKRLRGEKKWPTPEALKAQIGIDVGRAQRFFSLCRAAAKRREGLPEPARVLQGS